MPIPMPNSGEEQKEFIPRCIGIISKEFESQEQRVAVCYGQWRKSKKQDSIDKLDDAERTLNFNIDYSQESKFRIDKDTGFLHAQARLTRAGVFDYYSEDGELIREYRSEDEVFDEESIKSLRLKPITNDHPNEMVTSDNIKKYQIGTIGENIIRDGIFLLSNIIITDKDMVKTIVDRKKAGLNTELSCGYSCKLLSEYGVHEKDGYYIASQKKIKYNHVGVVNKGRAGENVKILDKKQNKEKESKTMGDKKVQFKRSSINLDSLKLDAITAIVDEDNLGVLNTISDSLDNAVNVITTIKKDKDELQGKFDQANETIKSLKEKIDSLTNIDSPEIMAMINKKNDVIETAKALGVNCDGKDLKTIQCDCIKAVSKNVDLTDKNEDYINARYEAVDELVKEQSKADGNKKFYDFMQKVNNDKSQQKSDPRGTFINKDKEQNRK